ncbi:hypothetical protein PMIN04_012889 [Paraphaeosphaeria minitans]|uniref:Uncharacterized protein n=1 Tax=Paraphaeosphaeria minitans TaxID=565426 RepID=A0A9P6G7G8_9PLEO|nr:hypothetical protein PMIN01_12207 [Paraphaeosphaeria minitans]
MATAVLDHQVIPGLHVAPYLSNLSRSSEVYNHLPDDADQPHVAEEHLKNLAGIFLRYNVQTKFGLHLIHGHFKLERDMVMLGKSVQEPSGCWTKPTDINEVDLENIHGHIYALTGDGFLVAYEYREGRPADMTDVKPDFFHEVIQYLQSNKLEHLLGLQVLSNEPQEKLAEFVLGANAGTVMIKETEANYGHIYRVTGWAFDQEDGIISCKGNDVHAATTKGPHKVFQDSKRIHGVRELRVALKEAEII